MTESEAQEQYVPKPLGAYLKRNYNFSTQNDTVEAMQMGKELWLAGRLQGLEEAAKIADTFTSRIACNTYEPFNPVAAAIREKGK